MKARALAAAQAARSRFEERESRRRDAAKDAPIMQLKGVHKSFGVHSVLRGLDLSIPAGKISFVIGRSGEGKSVTLKHIVGILRPDRGEVLFQGKSPWSAGRKAWDLARRDMGLLFQDGALFDSLSVFENVVFALREHAGLGDVDLREKGTELLEQVGLEGYEGKFPPELSIGEKKRVGLARALSMKPALLLYDEPTTGMDSLVSQLIDDLIVDTQRRNPGMSSVVVSHDVASILSIAEHIILLHEGKVYLEGPIEIFKNSKDPLIVQFLSGSRDGPLSKPIA